MPLDREAVLGHLSGEGNGQGPRDLSGLDLSGADLSRMDLRGVNLSRADLSQADLRWAVLEGADLHATVLRRADARWSILRGANMRQADLGRANFAWADVSGADLTGAEIDGAVFDNASLGEAIIERKKSRDWSLGAAGRLRPATAPTTRAAAQAGALGEALTSGWTLPEVTPTVVAVAAVATVVLIHLWGWLFTRSYFLDGFKLPPESGAVTLSQLSNLVHGLVDVLGLTLKVLVTAPLIIVAIVLVISLLLAIPIGCLWLAERVLGDVVVDRWRNVVIGGLFVAFAAGFFLLLPFLARGLQWAWANALPGDRGLRAALQVVQVGGPVAWLLGFGVAFAFVVALRTGWQWFKLRFTHYEMPVRWRLDYPALNAAIVAAKKDDRLVRYEPLTGEERQRGLLGLVAGVVLLATLLTNAGRVLALTDMCDGGSLPRGQAYAGGKPSDALPGDRMCQRLIYETPFTDGDYYLFFPGQCVERIPGEMTSRDPHWTLVTKKENMFVLADSPKADCPTCKDGPRGDERVVIRPNEIELTGAVNDQTGNMLLLDVKPNEIGSVRVSDTTRITKQGQSVDVGAIKPGEVVHAFGTVDTTGQILEATELNVMVGVAIATQGPPAVLNVDTSGGQTAMLSGANFKPGESVQIALEAPADPATGLKGGRNPLTLVTADDAGSFAAPINYSPEMPTGPGYTVVATGQSGTTAVSSQWYQAPPATPTLLPTVPPPTIETTPGAPGEATPTAPGAAPTAEGPAATNTPFRTPVAGPPPPSDCERDEFEYDNTRGFQKEIYTSFGEGQKQKHNFCPRRDIDLAFFRVKAGRWYRVSTTGLAPGVDTVLAVGDLSNDTICQPAGCWSDDKGSLTYEAEVVLQAVEDGTAIITVDNRGSKYGTDATYELSVVEFSPIPTGTPTFGPSETPTATPTSTATRPAVYDYCEGQRNYGSNDRCSRACQFLELNPLVADPAKRIIASLSSGTDEDWYETRVLSPGQYEVVLTVPDGQDYDMSLHTPVRPSSDDCPMMTGFIAIGTAIGGEEHLKFTVQGAPQAFMVRVFTKYPTLYGGPTLAYVLDLLSIGPTATFTPIPSPTPTLSPTPSATPTRTPTAPGDNRPRITVTPSPSPTPP